MANTRCFRSVTSVSPGERGRKEENRGNKPVWLLTVHQLPRAIILAAEGLDAEAGDGLSCLSRHSNKGCVICNMSMCAVILFFNPAYVSSSSCWHTFGINISGQNPCKLLWRFVIRAVSLHNILLYTTRKHQKILEHDGGSRNPIKYTRYDHWKVCSPYFSGAFCSIR